MFLLSTFFFGVTSHTVYVFCVHDKTFDGNSTCSISEIPCVICSSCEPNSKHTSCPFVVVTVAFLIVPPSLFLPSFFFSGPPDQGRACLSRIAININKCVIWNCSCFRLSWNEALLPAQPLSHSAFTPPHVLCPTSSHRTFDILPFFCCGSCNTRYNSLTLPCYFWRVAVL